MFSNSILQDCFVIRPSRPHCGRESEALCTDQVSLQRKGSQAVHMISIISAADTLLLGISVLFRSGQYELHLVPDHLLVQN